MGMKSLKVRDKEYIFNNLDTILTHTHIEKIWEMIWRRWRRIEEICNKADG